MSEAKKFDDNKPPMYLLDRVALETTAKVLAFGAKKYAEDNWRGGGKYTLACKRPLAAALRHIFAYLDGEQFDPESGISHLGHAMCSVMFALSAEERGFSDVGFNSTTVGGRVHCPRCHSDQHVTFTLYPVCPDHDPKEVFCSLESYDDSPNEGGAIEGGCGFRWRLL